MSHLLRRLLLIVILCLSMIACEKEELTIENPINEIEMQYISFELEVANVVNEHRKELGLPTLKLLNIISKEAESHSIYMVQKSSLNHDNLDTRISNLINKADALIVGENVAYGYNIAENVLQGWLNSETHREKIEGKYYTDFGISAKKNNSGGYYITQIFIKRD